MTAVPMVVDTNVVLVANRQHQDISAECVANCALALKNLMQDGKLVLDDRFLILNEYLNKTRPKIGNRPGDAFVKWALRNKANRKFVDTVAVMDNPVRGFDTFPDDPALAEFDPADRKFVAVAGAHAGPTPILQAADSKWLDWSSTLSQHGIAVTFLCPADIKRFHKNKFGI